MKEKVIFHNNVLDEIDGKYVQLGNKCQECGKVSYPAVERCPFCGSADIEKVELSKTGTVFTFNVIRVPVGPYKPPIIGAYVDLPDGTRVFGQIHAPVEEVKAGMKVNVETGVIWEEEDKEVIGYYYVPMQNTEGKE